MSSRRSTNLNVDFDLDQEARTSFNPESFELDSFNNDQDSQQFKQRRSPSPLYTYSWLNKLHHFIKGPEHPQDPPPTVIASLAPFDRFPYIIRHKHSSKTRNIILFIYVIIWLIINHWILSPQLSSPKNTMDSEEIISLSCTGSGFFWTGKNQQCGFKGELCKPFNHRDVVIKCPALCDRGWTYSSTPVGDQMVKYRQYAIGGGKLHTKLGTGDDTDKEINTEEDVLSYPYRGDSFPCSSAVHAGAISPYFGGCVKVSFDGEQFEFESKLGLFNTGFSIGFPSYFPSSFVFKKANVSLANCYDLRLIVLVVNFILGIPVMYLTPGIIGFWISSIFGFWTIVLSLDPPIIVDQSDPETVAYLFSIGFARLLPLSFILYVLWDKVIKRTLSDPTSSIAKTLLWYPLFWIGIANNITFDRLPVDRLTPQDIKQQPGGLITILFIVVTLGICIYIQGVNVWKSGRLRDYLKLYGYLLIFLIFLSVLPGLQLRLHHYLLALILIPGTSTRGISAFVLQGVLLGLLISGIARWDFASIVETNVSLMRGEAGVSSEPPVNFTYQDGQLSWNSTYLTDNYVDEDDEDELVGYSLIINDLERYVGNDTVLDIQSLISQDEELSGFLNSTSKSVPLYLRVGKSSLKQDSLSRGDYTKAGVLIWPQGDWIAPEEGVT